MSGPLAPRQLVLALDHSVSFAREDFLSGPSNVAALSLVERWRPAHWLSKIWKPSILMSRRFFT